MTRWKFFRLLLKEFENKDNWELESIPNYAGPVSVRRHKHKKTGIMVDLNNNKILDKGENELFSFGDFMRQKLLAIREKSCRKKKKEEKRKRRTSFLKNFTGF